MEPLDGTARRVVTLVARRHQQVARPQPFRQQGSVIARDRQVAAFFRTVGREGADDRMATGCQSTVHHSQVSFLICRFSQKMKRGLVMPDVEMPGRLSFQHVLLALSQIDPPQAQRVGDDRDRRQAHRRRDHRRQQKPGDGIKQPRRPRPQDWWRRRSASHQHPGQPSKPTAGESCASQSVDHVRTGPHQPPQKI